MAQLQKKEATAPNDEQKTQIIKRSEFQTGLLQFNLVAAGVITSLALREGNIFNKGLLLMPVISFFLFLLWIHHAITIRLMNWQPPPAWSFWQFLRVSTFAIAVIGNFVAIPAGCLFLYQAGVMGKLEAASRTLEIVGLFVLPGITAVLFGLWLWLQYFKRTSPDQNTLRRK